MDDIIRRVGITLSVLISLLIAVLVVEGWAPDHPIDTFVYAFPIAVVIALPAIIYLELGHRA